jgi:hypothetical protein
MARNSNKIGLGEQASGHVVRVTPRGAPLSEFLGIAPSCHQRRGALKRRYLGARVSWARCQITSAQRIWKLNSERVG